VISEEQYLKSPQAIAVNGLDLYVTDVATSDGNFGIGRVIHVDVQRAPRRSWRTADFSWGGGNCSGPERRPYRRRSLHDKSGKSDLYDGGIIRIDLSARTRL